jgi:methyltransferase, FkbM family
MNPLKEAIRNLAAKVGYDVRSTGSLGISPFADMKKFVPVPHNPLILDIGANVGQSVGRFRKTFPTAIIHSFEPGPETFKALSQNVARDKRVFAWNCGVGASAGQQTFQENTNSDMSSFLGLSTAGWGEVNRQTVVEMTSVDRFLQSNGISHVDILKSDTQGYELEVLKGAEEAMRENRIGLVYFEFIFSDMYKHLPGFDQLFRHLVDRNFSLVAIYDFHYQNRLASFADVLFINREYYTKTS